MIDYIIRPMDTIKRSFTIDVRFEILGVDIITKAKLDLGASRSIIPLRSLDFATKIGCSKDDEERVYSEIGKKLSSDGYELKSAYLTSSIKRIGTESPAVYFQTIPEIKLDDAVDICGLQMLLTIDTMGNVLIGMDILSQLEIHCGSSLVSDELVNMGDYILLASKIEGGKKKDFYHAMERYLGYRPI